MSELPVSTLQVSALRRRARARVDGARAAADARWGRPRHCGDAGRPVYLVAPAGHPNHGDEQLLAGWLRHLRHHRPGTPVVVDCHTPGQAAVLHHGEHPDVLFTDTLWRVAGECAELASDIAVAAIDLGRRAVADLGVRPAVASGIDLLRSASTVHLIGGGYVNDQWPHHLGVAAAAGAAGRHTGARVVATGQGLVPCDDADLLADAFRDFATVAVRDAASYNLLAATDVPVRLVGDDGWLALSGIAPTRPADSAPPRPVDHPVYSTDPDTCRDLVLCVQSDLGHPDILADAVARVLADWAIPGERMTVVESIPGGDRVVWDEVCARGDDDEVGAALSALDLPRARFVPFQELWATGLPARPGQTWLTTRFHAHLFAAARGASGVALRLGSEYYDVKHGSLADAGSPWQLLGPQVVVVPDPPTAAGFGAAAVGSRIWGAEALAAEIYPRS